MPQGNGKKTLAHHSWSLLCASLLLTSSLNSAVDRLLLNIRIQQAITAKEDVWAGREIRRLSWPEAQQGNARHLRNPTEVSPISVSTYSFHFLKGSQATFLRRGQSAVHIRAFPNTQKSCRLIIHKPVTTLKQWITFIFKTSAFGSDCADDRHNNST